MTFDFSDQTACLFDLVLQCHVDGMTVGDRQWRVIYTLGQVADDCKVAQDVGSLTGGIGLLRSSASNRSPDYDVAVEVCFRMYSVETGCDDCASMERVTNVGFLRVAAFERLVPHRLRGRSRLEEFSSLVFPLERPLSGPIACGCHCRRQMSSLGSRCAS